MHDPSSITRSRTQIIPICVIGAGSDEIGAAAQITAGRSAIIKTPLRCVVATVTQLCGQRTGRIFMHRRASGEHPNLPH